MATRMGRFRPVPGGGSESQYDGVREDSQGRDRRIMAQLQQLRLEEGDWLCWLEKSRRNMLPELAHTIIIFHQRFQEGKGFCSALCIQLLTFQAIYQIPTEDEESFSNSAYTLQRLFYQLQSSANAVGTNELTKSFGWETRHIFEQQDVQELSRKLMERMEEKMKGTEAENVLSRLFCGKVRTYISCINVEYESRRVEDYWDIQLNVNGLKDVEASFRDYVQVETMDGENQYFAGDTFKLQDAKKGVIFESFPEVLHLQLKRFQYDIDRDAMMKINDRYEFPDSFDAAPYLADDADKSESWIYQLHGVLVHSGDLNAGHYYAFIKPTKDGWFYKYDDDRVTKATMREVLEDNYGGEYILPNGQAAKVKSKPVLRHNSAYMLVYIRQSRVDQVLLPVTEEDIPSHLRKCTHLPLN